MATSLCRGSKEGKDLGLVLRKLEFRWIKFDPVVLPHAVLAIVVVKELHSGESQSVRGANLELSTGASSLKLGLQSSSNLLTGHEAELYTCIRVSEEEL